MGDIKKKSKEDWGLNKDMVERETNVESWKGNWVEDWLCLLLIRRKRLSSTTLHIDSLAWSKVTQKFQERMSFVIFYLLRVCASLWCGWSLGWAPMSLAWISKLQPGLWRGMMYLLLIRSLRRQKKKYLNSVQHASELNMSPRGKKVLRYQNHKYS